jgi:hypothetical protein
MKKLFSSRPVGILFALIAAIVFARLSLFAAEKKEARVTVVIKDVRLMAAQNARPATLNDNVREGTAVRTGGDSRAELTFADKTLTRLGANTVFSFGEGAKSFDLSSGAMLLSVPKEAGATRVNIGAATAAVTGFTGLFENNKGINKLILLEGHGTISFRGIPGDLCQIDAGQMIVWPAHPVRCPERHTVNIEKITKSAKLITLFDPLPNKDLIDLEIVQQNTSGPPPNGYTDPTNQDELDQHAATNPPNTPRPSFTGSPPGQRPFRVKPKSK